MITQVRDFNERVHADVKITKRYLHMSNQSIKEIISPLNKM
jgi:hypothetical protein